MKPVVTLEELSDAVKAARPRTADDVSITLDGSRLDSQEKVLAFLAEIEADRVAGRPVVEQVP